MVGGWRQGGRTLPVMGRGFPMKTRVKILVGSPRKRFALYG